MKYSVEWTDDAMADLWELWSSPSEHSYVSEASRTIEQLLEQNPLDERHEVVNGKGIVIRGPLGVDFLVDDARRVVHVTAAWSVSEGA